MPREEIRYWLVEHPDGKREIFTEDWDLNLERLAVFEDHKWKRMEGDIYFSASSRARLRWDPISKHELAMIFFEGD